MGLDNFWILPGQQPHPNFNPPLNLCGGMFSSHGQESFRGKVYASFCEEAMGINLYKDSLSNEELLNANLNLSKWLETQSTWETLSKQEILDVQRMFNKYASLGATLESWY